MKVNRHIDISSAGLHILAMAAMLLDHSWALLFPTQEWMTWVGRIAYPIFAFLIVEGYFHTRSFKRYLLRMLLFALVTEPIFDLMYADSLFYPFHQNVLWTFLIALVGVRLMDQVGKKGKLWLTVLTDAGVVLLGYLAGTVGMVDYYGAGVWTVFLFYFFRGQKWWCYLGQLAGMYYLNVEMLGSRYYPITMLGMEFDFYPQSLALLSLIPIWLYRGRQGHHSKAFQYFCYAFYPVHILLLYLLTLLPKYM